MNGSGRPLFGSALVTTPMLMAACKRNQKRDARREQGAEVVARVERDANPADRDETKREHDQQRGDQAQFLADVGKNKIGVDFRDDNPVFCKPLPRPRPVQPPEPSAIMA